MFIKGGVLMKANLNIYTIEMGSTLIQALKKIDNNKKGFLVVINDLTEVKGTLTDGDIRRGFITGLSVNDPIEMAYKMNYTALSLQDGVPAAIDLFKNNAIRFLPIIDERSRLVNIITKNQLHSMLLQDIHANLMYDFQSLDDTIVDHEIFQKPWGFYKTTVMNDYCQAKIMCVYPGAQLSLQSHAHREEHWIVAHGIGKVQLGESELEAKCGDAFFIPKGCKHRLVNTGDKESLVITEVQIGDYFGEDDIQRFEDIYGRA